MPWHLEPVLFTARHYDDPGGHEAWDEFGAVLTLQMLGGGRAMISGAHGRITREMRDELEAALRSLGVTELQAWRKRKLVTWR